MGMELRAVESTPPGALPNGCALLSSDPKLIVRELPPAAFEARCMPRGFAESRYLTRQRRIFERFPPVRCCSNATTRRPSTTQRRDRLDGDFRDPRSGG